jgi:hypothetical protein
MAAVSRDMFADERDHLVCPPSSSGRARRNSDWFFESWQGLYADDEGEPLAFVVNPAAYKGAHFATFPPRLVEPMVRVGTSEKGCCPRCGKPWERVVESRRIQTRNIKNPKSLSPQVGNANVDPGRHVAETRTLGWRPACECPEASSLKPQACVVLDPFSGAGTTAMVAAQLGRRAIGIDLSEKYNRMAATRIGRALRPATFIDQDTAAEFPLLADTVGLGPEARGLRKTE